MTKGDDVTEPAAKGEALPEVLTVEQAAALLQLSPKTVKRLAQRGGVPGGASAISGASHGAR